MQAATLERQLPNNSTLSVTFLHITGSHVPDIVNVNSPYPGTYNPDDPSSGMRPLGNAAAMCSSISRTGFTIRSSRS